MIINRFFPAKAGGIRQKPFRKVTLLAALTVILSISFLPIFTRNDTVNAADPTVLWSEDFENGQGANVTYLNNYAGADGTTYATTSGYASACAGLLGSEQWPSTMVPGYCNDPTHWAEHRSMARHLAQTFGPTDPNLNHAVTYVMEQGASANIDIPLATTNFSMDMPEASYITVQFDVISPTDGGPDCRVPTVLEPEIFIAGGWASLGDVNPCDNPDAVVNEYAMKRFIAEVPYPTAGPSTITGLRIVNRNNAPIETRFGIDNIQLIKNNPQLEIDFNPDSLPVGQVSTLEFTITNTPDQGEKDGFTFETTLPTGLTVASPSNDSISCSGGSMNVTAGNPLISGFGNLTAGQVSCTASVDVISSTPGTYTLTPASFDNSNINVPSNSAQVTFTASADIEVDKTAQNPTSGALVTTYPPGGNLDFNIDVINHGPTVSPSITLSDTIPTGFTPTGYQADQHWSCDINAQVVSCTRPAGMTLTTESILIHTSVDAALTGPQSNSATAVVANNGDPNTGNNTGTVNLTEGPTADLSITKSHSGTPIVDQNYDYEFTVTNHGPKAVSSFTVTDNLDPDLSYVTATGISCSGAPNLTCTGGALNPQDTAQFSITVHVEDTFPGGNILNSATVAPPPGVTDPNPSNNTATDDTDVEASADLAVTKNHVGDFEAGEQEQYTITVTNNGPDAATGITMTDTLPAGLQYVSADGGVDWTCGESSGIITCTYTGSLAASTAAADIIVQVNVSPLLRGQVTNTAHVSSNVFDDDSNNNTSDDLTTITADADLGILKSHTGNFEAGDTGEFDITVTNTGPSATPSFTVQDTLDSEFTFINASGDANCGAVGQLVTCNGGMLASGQNAVITVLVLVHGDTPAISIDNTATVQPPGDTPDTNQTNNSDTDSVTIELNADLGIVKRHNNTFYAGQNNATYSITVYNHGPSNLSSFTVTDPLDSNLSFISGQGANCSAVGQDVTCTGGTINSGDQVVITLTVGVSINATPHTTISNTATANVPGGVDDPNVGNNSSTVQNLIIESTDLSIALSHGDNFQPGKDSQYTIVVTNNGPSNSPVSNVSVTNKLPQHVSYQSSSGSGWSCTESGGSVDCDFSGTLTVGQSSTLNLAVHIDANAQGQLVDTASVTPKTFDSNLANNTAEDTVSLGFLAETGQKIVWWVVGAVMLIGLSLLLLQSSQRKIGN